MLLEIIQQESHLDPSFRSKNNLDERVFTGTGLEKVWAVGSGMMLVKREVYEKLLPPTKLNIQMTIQV